MEDLIYVSHGMNGDRHLRISADRSTRKLIVDVGASRIAVDPEYLWDYIIRMFAEMDED
jgi:hypothetical protein